jgi:hypothetical protein
VLSHRVKMENVRTDRIIKRSFGLLNEGRLFKKTVL